MIDYNETRLARIESKLDSLNEAITTLARIDERMLSHMEAARRLGSRLDDIEPRVTALELSKAKFAGIAVGIASVSSVLSAIVSKFFGS